MKRVSSKDIRYSEKFTRTLYRNKCDNVIAEGAVEKG